MFSKNKIKPQRPTSSILRVRSTIEILRRRWWSQSGSNRRPPACKAGALPAELWPQVRCLGSSVRSRGRVVGLGGLEPPASPLSGVRSNHLSYRPVSASHPRLAQMPSRLQVTCEDARANVDSSCSKGGDPAAPSGTATLLRLHPSHEAHRGRRLPFG